MEELVPDVSGNLLIGPSGGLLSLPSSEVSFIPSVMFILTPEGADVRATCSAPPVPNAVSYVVGFYGGEGLHSFIFPIPPNLQSTVIGTTEEVFGPYATTFDYQEMNVEVIDSADNRHPVGRVTTTETPLEFVPFLQASLLEMATALTPAERGAILYGLSGGLVENGEVWRTPELGGTLEGLPVALDVVSTQQDILEGLDTGVESVSAESVGGLGVQRVIPYAATVDIIFTGTTPVWGFNNIITCTGALALQADTFPYYMVGRLFTTICQRLSGTGNVTVQNKSGGANVQFADGLSAIPALGTTVGSDIVIEARVISTSLWRVERVSAKTL